MKGIKRKFRKHQSLFRIRLGVEGPANIVSMKFKLDPAKKPVRVKVHKHPGEQRNFLDAYIFQLVKVGYLHPSRDGFW